MDQPGCRFVPFGAEDYFDRLVILDQRTGTSAFKNPLFYPVIFLILGNSLGVVLNLINKTA